MTVTDNCTGRQSQAAREYDYMTDNCTKRQSQAARESNSHIVYNVHGKPSMCITGLVSTVIAVSLRQLPRLSHFSHFTH